MCVQIESRSSWILRQTPLRRVCQSFRSRTSEVSKGRPSSSSMSIRSPLSRATTCSLTCREYGKNFSGISSRLALSKGTFSASALLPNTTTKSLSLDSVERQRRVARPTPNDAVPVRRFGPAPQEDQPECVHVMPNATPRHRIKCDGGRADVEKAGRESRRGRVWQYGD